MSILTRWRNRPVSVRRARAMYEAARLRRQIAEVRAENEHRERDRNRPCPFCAAAEAVPTFEREVDDLFNRIGPPPGWTSSPTEETR